MHRDKVVKLLNLLGAKNIKNGHNDQWVTCSCIFAPWKHWGGKDNTPSFGISVDMTGVSKCNCFTCGSTGDLFDLFMELRGLNREEEYYDVNFKEILQLIATEENEEDDFDLDLPDYEDILSAKKGKPLNEFPEEWLQSFFACPDHPYLKERGVSFKTAKDLDIRYDGALKRVCFPIRTTQGVLAGMQGRAIEKTHPLRYKLYDYKGKFNPDVWGNESGVNLSEPLIITEGFFDLTKIYGVYENVVASLTSKITYNKYKRLQDAEDIVTFFDFGTGGNHARELVEQYWKNAIIRHIVPHQEVGDAGNMDEEDIREILIDVEVI
jgi:DNA primase